MGEPHDEDLAKRIDAALTMGYTAESWFAMAQVYIPLLQQVHDTIVRYAVREQYLIAKLEATTESWLANPRPPFDSEAWKRVGLNVATPEDYEMLYASKEMGGDGDETA